MVTGATGFIGQHLVQRLVQARYQVRVVVRPSTLQRNWPANVSVFEGDIRDAAKMKEAASGANLVFHLAGRSHALSEWGEDDAAYRPVNVEGTRNVLEGAVAGGAQTIVFFSSVKVFGEETTECIDENARRRPTTPYGRSKVEAEDLVHDYTMTARLRSVSLRLPLVYGPQNKGNIQRMIWAIDHYLFPPFPDLPNRRSLVHVTNVVEAALLAALQTPKSPSYIVTDCRPYSTRELYTMTCGALGRRVPQWQVPLRALILLGKFGTLVGRTTRRRFPIDSESLAKLTGSAWYSSRRISQELGYDPVLDFKSALPELIAAYRSHKDVRGPWTQ
jgi:nucleoside-diphosphate-sugar epimerase